MAKHLDIGAWVVIILVGLGMVVASTLWLQSVDAAQDITLTQHEGRLDNHDVQLKELQKQDGKLDDILGILQETQKGN